MLPLVMMLQILAVDLPHPLELGQDATEITLIAPADAGLLRRLITVAGDPSENLVLRLHRVEADEVPKVSWEVYVASSDPLDCDNVPELAGILSLYGALPGAAFVLPLDAALLATQPIGLKVIFRPTSGLIVDGEPVPPNVRTTVRIGDISLETEKASNGKSR